MAKIEGIYQKQTPKGKSIYHCLSNNISIVVAQRKNTSPNKPQKYLLQKLINGKYKYISSLFSIHENLYSLDHEGISYTLNDVGGDRLTITSKFNWSIS